RLVFLRLRLRRSAEGSLPVVLRCLVAQQVGKVDVGRCRAARAQDLGYRAIADERSVRRFVRGASTLRPCRLRFGACTDGSRGRFGRRHRASPQAALFESPRLPWYCLKSLAPSGRPCLSICRETASTRSLIATGRSWPAARNAASSAMVLMSPPA